MDWRKPLTWFLVVGIIVLSSLLAWEFLYRRPHQRQNSQVEQLIRLSPMTTVAVEHPDRPHWIPDKLEHKETIRTWMNFSFTTNDEGFRGRDFGPAKAAGSFRIIVVGECVAFGFGVSDDEPYPVLLEAAINSAADRPVEVFNLSLFGVAPQGILALLREHADALAPDLIIFAPGTDTVFVPEHVSSPARLDLGQQKYGHMLRAYYDILAQAVLYARKLGKPIVLVTPTMNSFFVPDGFRWLKVMKDFAAQQEIPFFDTTALVTKVEHSHGLVLETDGGLQRLVRYQDGNPEGLFETPFILGTEGRHVAPAIYSWLDDNPTIRPVMNIDENHLTPEGHRIVADALFAFLQSHNLLPSQSN